jgi:hypothetical protein
VTERYTRAIEQLGSDKIDIRLGGIYSLERIATDSTRDHPTIMEVLTAFIREHTATSDDLHADTTHACAPRTSYPPDHPACRRPTLRAIGPGPYGRCGDREVLAAIVFVAVPERLVVTYQRR